MGSMAALLTEQEVHVIPRGRVVGDATRGKLDDGGSDMASTVTPATFLPGVPPPLQGYDCHTLSGMFLNGKSDVLMCIYIHKTFSTMDKN